MPRRTRRPPEPRAWRGRAGSGPARETPRARPALPRGRRIRRSSSWLFQTQSGVSRTKTCGVPRATTKRNERISVLSLPNKHARRDVALRTPPTHSRCHTSARSISMSACVSSPVAARAPASGANAPRARRSVACAARADRSADEAKSVSVADRLRGAAVATAAAAALVACAPEAALANAFDGDLSPTNGPLKSLPKGARAPPPPRVPSRDFRSFLVLLKGVPEGWGTTPTTPNDTTSAASAFFGFARRRDGTRN